MFEGTDVWVPDFDDDRVQQIYKSSSPLSEAVMGVTRQSIRSTLASSATRASSKAHLGCPFWPTTGIWENDPEPFQYAIRAGLGWRVDRWGGRREIRQIPEHTPDVADAWRGAPVILEPCGVMSEWPSEGYSWRISFQWAIDNHVSEISNKSAPIPQRDDGRCEDHANETRIPSRAQASEFPGGRESRSGLSTGA